jgi:hypothetical protein
MFKNVFGPKYTDKKEKKIFLIHKEIQMGAVAKSHMKMGFLIYEEMHKYLVIYEEAASHILLYNRFLLDFIIYLEIFCCFLFYQYTTMLCFTLSSERLIYSPVTVPLVYVV